MSESNIVAGDGTPYWYEWSVALEQIVEMLNPDSGIESVTIQDRTAQGWDDVCVRKSNKKVTYFQVKHSTTDTNLTFGSFFEKRRDGTALITYLFQKWLSMDIEKENSTFVFFTNRTAGVRGNTTDGIFRPPLNTFYKWLSVSLPKVSDLSELKPTEQWQGAWELFLSHLTTGTGEPDCSDHEILLFLKSLKVDHGQAELEGLQANIEERLATIFGKKIDRIRPVAHSLDASLRTWSSGGNPVTIDVVYDALILPEESQLPENIAPAIPSPFFSSRKEDAKNLAGELLSNTPENVIFLEGVPGAGKTSLVSKLCSDLVEQENTQTIGLRYFAFTPLKMGSKVVPTDADDHVTAEGLWFTLLNQLRRILKGNLFQYRVPIRNSFLSVVEAKQHVLRIANELGEKIGRRYVIAIDGIDHAARAGRYSPDQAEEFFNSLPSPDLLSERYPNIKILIAGQPASFYPGYYPSWISNPNRNKVKTIYCGKLNETDIVELIKNQVDYVEDLDVQKILEVIIHHTQKNTLAVVYACNEIIDHKEAKELSAHLDKRKLSDGITSYYEEIWKSVKSRLGKNEMAESSLAVALTCIREPLNETLLTDAYRELGMSKTQWQIALDTLKPLVSDVSSGVVIRHNDLRVFLTNHLQNKSHSIVQNFAMQLFEYYRKESSDVRTAHVTIPILLREANREDLWASVFNCKWVCQSAALSEPIPVMMEHCKKAYEAVQSIQDWNLLHKVSIGGRLLLQWQYIADTLGDSHLINKNQDYLPGYLNVEGPPLCKDKWTPSIVREALDAICRLYHAEEINRARASFDNWFNSINALDLQKLANYQTNSEWRYHQDCSLFSRFSETARLVESEYVADLLLSIDEESDLSYALWEGWMEASIDYSVSFAKDLTLGVISPFYDHIEHLILEVGKTGSSALFSEILDLHSEDFDELSKVFKIRLGWYLVKHDQAEKYPKMISLWWQEDLKLEHSLNFDHQLDTKILCEFGYLCGHYRSGIDPSEIGIFLFSNTYSDTDWSWKANLILEAAGIVGSCKKQIKNGKELIYEPDTIVRLIDSLTHMAGQVESPYEAPSFRNSTVELVEELISICRKSGSRYIDRLKKVCIEIVEKLDSECRYGLDPVWQFLSNVGKQDLVKERVFSLIGNEGSFWNENDIFRDDSVEFSLQEIKKLCEIADEVSLYERSIYRAKGMRITHLSHKDSSFEDLYLWLIELPYLGGVDWQKVVSEVLGINDLCRHVNSYYWDIQSIVGSIATVHGPNAIYNLVTTPPSVRENGEDSYNRVRQFITGATDAITANKELKNKQAIDCITVLKIGVEDLYQSKQSKEIKNYVQTVSNFLAAPNKTDFKNIFKDFFVENEEHASEETSLSSFERVMLKIKQVSVELEGEKRVHAISKLINEFDSKSEYTTRWRYSPGGLNAEIVDAWKTLNTEEQWNFIGKSWQMNQESSYWLEGVNTRVQSLVRINSLGNGIESYLEKMEEHIQFHKFLLGGVSSNNSETKYSFSESVENLNWVQCSAQILLLTLKSMFANPVERALHGLGKLLKISPESYIYILQQSSLSDWQVKWLLGLGEVWVRDNPDLANRNKNIFNHYLNSPSLDIRIMAWICISQLRNIGYPQQEFFSKNLRFEQPPYDLTNELIVQPSMRGAMRLTSDHEAIKTSIRKLLYATGVDLSHIRGDFTAWLIHQDPGKADTNNWPMNLATNRDFWCDRDRCRYALNMVLGREVSRASLPTKVIPKFASAILGDDEPALFCQRARDASSSEYWPSSSLNSQQDQDGLRTDTECHRLLAVKCELEAGWVCIGAEVQTFDYNKDKVFRYWASKNVRILEIEKEKFPTTMHGRTYSYLLDEHLVESSYWKERGVLVSFVGGSNFLSNSQLRVFPTNLWREKFGWQPNYRDPLTWFDELGIVARYERLCGSVDHYSDTSFRVPMVHRWVVRRNALEALNIDPTEYESYEVFPYNE